MKYCNCHDVTSVYSLNSWKLPGCFSYSLGTRLTLHSLLSTGSFTVKLPPHCSCPPPTHISTIPHSPHPHPSTHAHLHTQQTFTHHTQLIVEEGIAVVPHTKLVYPPYRTPIPRVSSQCSSPRERQGRSSATDSTGESPFCYHRPK